MKFTKSLLVITLLVVIFELAGSILLVGLSTQPEIGLEKGLVAYWKFDEGEGDIAFDETENYNDGGLLCVGESCTPPRWVEGKIGYALEFDGVNYLDGGNDPSLNMGTGEWAVVGWLKATYNTTRRYRILDKGSKYWLIFIRVNTGQLGIVSGNGTDADYFVSPSIFADNEWHHFVIVRNDDNIIIYHDGVIDRSFVSSNYDQSNNNALVLGGVSGDSKAHPFNGTIDEVRIYNRALTEDESKALYKQGQEE